MGKVKKALEKISKRPRGRPPKTRVIEKIVNMDYIRPVDKLNLNGNLAENWRIFIQNFEIFSTAIELEKKPEKVKIAVFLNAIGSDAVEVFNSFNLSVEEKGKYETVLKAFTTFCAPRKNEVYDSFVFLSRNQSEGEPFDQFLMDIKKLVRSCGYGSEESRMLRDKIVMGVSDKQLQKRLLETASLTLDKAVEMARLAEITNQQSKEMSKTNQVDDALSERFSKVDVVKGHPAKKTGAVGRSPQSSNSVRPKVKYKSNNDEASFLKSDYFSNQTNSNVKSGNAELINCYYCCQNHMAGRCPAYGKQCRNCGRDNHFAIACRVKKVREVKFTTDGEEFYIDTLQNNLSYDSSWVENVRVDDIFIKFKLDTGAEVNVLPYSCFKKIKNAELTEGGVRLTAYGGSKVNTLGVTELACRAKNEMAMLKFVVVQSDSTPILGLNSCTELKLIKRIETIEKVNKEQFCDENSDVFEGLGCFIENFEIALKEDAVPVVKPARRIPITLRTRLKNELDKLEEKGIIEKLNEPADWVSQLVVVEKANKSLRICLDPQELNKALKPQNYIIPSLEDILPKLANKRYFTLLDLKDGYWQVKLSENSSKLCSFNTPFGCYRFKRLPFGLKVAPEIFQKCSERNFGDIKGVIVYIDDILITAETVEEHDMILKQVMNRARQLNIKFNRDKLQLKKKSVNFLGHIITEKGISYDPSRVEDIQEISEPKDKKDVQKLLGLINYMRSFIPNLAELSKPLRELLKKNMVFKWLPSHTKCLTAIKQQILAAPTLKTFDCNKDITIQADASKNGLGACIMQDGKPVAFASRSLSEAETNYAQIEKEMLAIVFACKKYHNWIYGRNVNVITDHKPLLGIMSKEISKIPSSRLQRMRLRLLNYNITLEYVPGKYLFVADFLSRNPNPNKTTMEIIDLNEVVHTINISDDKRELFKKETENDVVLADLKRVVENGWPKTKNKISDKIKFYWKHKNDITVEDGLLFLNEKLIIPVKLQKHVLNVLHQAHLGIEKTKARARQLVYWPGINNNIEDLISKCTICQKFRSGNRKEPMIAHDIPQYAFFKVGIDICMVDREEYLVVVDYFSKFLEIKELKRKTCKEIIEHLKPFFATHGIPREIVSDNVPFGSLEFQNFAKRFDIKLITSSPHYPRSNGLAEKYVHIAKNLIKKAKDDKQELWVALLEYRNTPIKDLDLSPSEICFGRHTRALMPGKMCLFRSQYTPNLGKNFEFKTRKAKIYYDRGSQWREEFKINQPIWYRNGRVWVKAVIQGKHPAPRSYWIQLDDGRILRRNSSVLRKRK